MWQVDYQRFRSLIGHVSNMDNVLSFKSGLWVFVVWGSKVGVVFDWFLVSRPVASRRYPLLFGAARVARL